MNLSFIHIEDACKFLGDNYKKIIDWFPVESIEIKYNINRKK